MGDFNIDIAEIKKLVKLVETYNLDEISVEQNDLAVTIKSKVAKAQHALVQQPAHVSPNEEIVAEEYISLTEQISDDFQDANVIDICAEIVGVFYRSPSPDAPFFVEIGDKIEVGTEIGLIEAMKVYSPIPSEISGIVVDIPAKNGQLVQQGEVLIKVKISEV